MAKQVRRLYSSFQPESYDLVLSLDPKNMKFDGSVIITGNNVGRPTKRITLHQKDLKVRSVKVTELNPKGNKAIPVTRVNIQKSFNELRLHFDSLIKSGKYQIEIEYSGLINSQLHGIYKSSFKEAGKTKTIICTQ